MVEGRWEGGGEEERVLSGGGRGWWVEAQLPLTQAAEVDCKRNISCVHVYQGSSVVHVEMS